jgi:putative aldouronate transport system permease protein
MGQRAGSRTFLPYRVLLGVVLMAVAATMVVPILTVVSTSLAPEAEVIRYGMRIVPTTGLSLESYRYILLGASGFARALWVSVTVTSAGTVLSMIVTCLMAYPMSKFHVPGRKAVFLYCFFTMLFHGGLIPTFFVVRGIGLLNSLWALIVPSLMSVWYMILLSNFFASIPASLEESAVNDGANDLWVLARIVLPLSLPAIATIGLFTAVGFWNSWFPAVIYINDRGKYPMQTILREMLYSLSYGTVLSATIEDTREPPSTAVRSAAIVVATLPIALVYPFIQKHFVKGVMIGAIKG